LPSTPASDCPVGGASGSPATPVASYSVRFIADWSVANNGVLPRGSHFSSLIGAVHDADYALWADGGIATNGIEVMAETGGVSSLRSEITTQITAGNARAIISGGGNSASGTASAKFEAACAHPLASAVSMVAPSPDWFVGVHDISLLDDSGQWRANAEYPLYVYDAGTDSGPDYSSGDVDLTPHIPIVRLAGNAMIGLQESLGQDQIGRMVFSRSPGLSDGIAQTFKPDQAISDIIFTNTGSRPNADDATTPGCTATNLPAGLTISRTENGLSCRITGTPMVPTSGSVPTTTPVTVTVTVTATNEGGTTTATVDITVNPPASTTPLEAPALTNAPAKTFTQGQPITDITFANTGGAPNADDASTPGCTATSLPAGLTIGRTDNGQSCRITGTPMTSTSGAVTVTATATNAIGADTATVDITVNPPAPPLAAPVLVDATAQTFMQGQPITDVAFTNTGGAPNADDASPPGCTASANLPAGLTIGRTDNDQSCRITGTPMTSTSGAVTVTATATNAIGADTATVDITVNPPAPPLVAPVLVDATAQTFMQGQPITDVTFTNTGGAPNADDASPPGCTASANLPAGLTIGRTDNDQSCRITGTPMTPTSGAVTVTVTASNVSGVVSNPGGAGMATVDITVNPLAPVLVNALAQTFIENQLVTDVIFVNNGGAPMADTTGCMASGLPAGLTVARTVNGQSCRITGTPMATTAATTVTVTATNAGGADMATVSITVNAAALPTAIPVLSDASSNVYTQGVAITDVIFTNAGGEPDADGATPPGCAVDKALPAGLMLARSDDNTSCRIYGTPMAVAATDTYTVTATNASGSATASIVITVALPQPTFSCSSGTMAAAPVARYTVRFIAEWSVANNGFLPGGAHFSSLIGAAHNTDYIMWQPGGIASNGIESMAEFGSTSTLRSEVTNQINSGGASEIIAGGGNGATGTARDTFDATCAHPLASAVSMVAPSPDWFVGVHGISLLDDSGQWRANAEYPLYVYDAGTDSGPAFTSRDADITPHIPIVRLAGSPSLGLQASLGQDRIGRMVFDLIAAPVLVDATPRTVTQGERISPVIFTNTGGAPNTDDATPRGCTATGLPAGMSVGYTDNGPSCSITGAPTASIGSPVTVTATITARNAGGTSMAMVDITVNPPAPPLPSAPVLTADDATVTFTQDQAITAITFANTGDAPNADSDTPRGCTISGLSGALATDLTASRTVDGLSCQVTGTPTATTAGAVTVTVTATNAGGTGMATVSITVNPAAPALTADDATVTLTQDQAITDITFTNAGGAPNADSDTPRGCTISGLSGALATDLTASRTVDGLSCLVTGTPTATTAGAVTVTVSATNAGGTGMATVSITVNPVAPALTNATSQTFIQNQAIPDITFANSGGAPNADSADPRGCTATGLPASLTVRRTVNGLSCLITGTPTATTTSAVTATVTATNAGGMSSATVSITVNAPAPPTTAPALTDATSVVYTRGQVISDINFLNAGGEPNADSDSPSGCATDKALPLGLMLARSADRRSCRIFGTPIENTATDTYTITATNAGGADTATVSITVNPPAPVLTNAVAQTFTQGQDITPITFTSTGGPPNADTANPRGCTISGLPGALATDLTVSRTADGLSCRITGTPTITTSGAVTVTVSATNGGGTGMAAVSITVNPPAPALSADTATHTFTQGQAITDITFTSTGGPPNADTANPRGCTISGLPGALATDLTVSRTVDNSSCRITGTPTITTTGAVTVTVTATNAGGVDTATVDITVNPPAPVLSADTATHTFTQGQAITDITFTNTGGAPNADSATPRGCTISGLPGALATDLTVSRTANGLSCRITGTPTITTTGAVTVTVTATNAGGVDTATVDITVNPPAPALTNAAAQTFTQ
ncbi:MAG: putative Ig domain-containing protein, partial [Proteobacteria bacterium]|nr:putative Ig domain-containing protein [Pseudomonadota bacterium]